MRNSNFIAGICLIFLMGIFGQVGAAETLYRDTPWEKFVAGGMKWFTEGDEETQGKYIGEVKNGVPDGNGTITFPNGVKYIGTYKDGLKHGQGTLTGDDGYKYVGKFKDGKLDGQASLTKSDGGKYVGEFRDDKLDGQGTYYYPDGRKYVGGWEKNKRHGHGTLTFPDGRKYVGDFLEHKLWEVTGYDKNGKLLGSFWAGKWVPN